MLNKIDKRLLQIADNLGVRYMWMEDYKEWPPIPDVILNSPVARGGYCSIGNIIVIKKSMKPYMYNHIFAHELLHTTNWSRRGLQYNQEEVVAEHGCNLILSHLGIDFDEEFSKRYIDGYNQGSYIDKNLQSFTKFAVELLLRELNKAA